MLQATGQSPSGEGAPLARTPDRFAHIRADADQFGRDVGPYLQAWVSIEHVIQPFFLVGVGVTAVGAGGALVVFLGPAGLVPGIPLASSGVVLIDAGLGLANQNFGTNFPTHFK